MSRNRDSTSSSEETRYLGIDLHKHYLVIGGVNLRQEVVLPPRRVELDAWLAWAQQHLRPTDVLVVEATGNTWTFYDAAIEFVMLKSRMPAGCPGSARPRSKLTSKMSRSWPSCARQT